MQGNLLLLTVLLVLAAATIGLVKFAIWVNRRAYESERFLRFLWTASAIFPLGIAGGILYYFVIGLNHPKGTWDILVLTFTTGCLFLGLAGFLVRMGTRWDIDRLRAFTRALHDDSGPITYEHLEDPRGETPPDDGRASKP